MGRQTAVAMTDEDEVEFLLFLRECGEVRLIESFAPNPTAFIVSSFAPREAGHWKYLLWNTEFHYEFKFNQVNSDVTGPHERVLYVADSFAAPFIEYDRHNFLDTQGLTYGRVYWPKCTDRYGAYLYDVEAFGRWFDTVVRWIRKRGRRRVKGAYNVYYLPDAWARYGRQPISGPPGEAEPV